MFEKPSGTLYRLVDEWGQLRKTKRGSYFFLIHRYQYDESKKIKT